MLKKHNSINEETYKKSFLKYPKVIIRYGLTLQPMAT